MSSTTNFHLSHAGQMLSLYHILKIFDTFLWNGFEIRKITKKLARRLPEMWKQIFSNSATRHRHPPSLNLRSLLSCMDMTCRNVSSFGVQWRDLTFSVRRQRNLYSVFILRNHIFSPCCRENLFSTKMRKLKLPWNIPFFNREHYLLSIIKVQFNQCT